MESMEKQCGDPDFVRLGSLYCLLSKTRLIKTSYVQYGSDVMMNQACGLLC